MKAGQSTHCGRSWKSTLWSKLYADTIYEVKYEELFNHNIVSIRWDKFYEIRSYIRDCQDKAFLEGINEIFEAIIHVMYLHHIMNCSGTSGVLEKIDKLSEALYGEFLVGAVFLKENYMYESHKRVPCFLFLERRGNTIYIDGNDGMINFFNHGREAQIQLLIASDFNLDLRNKEEINRFMKLGSKLIIKENNGKKELWYELNWNFVKMDEEEMRLFWVYIYDGCRNTRKNYIWQDWW